MTPTIISVQWLRRCVGILGVSLPLVLMGIAGPQESISAYYHTAGHDVFVGWLSLICGALAAYRGYDRSDRWCARVAALGLVAVIFAPTGDDWRGWVHLAGALVFFGAVAMLTWRFGKGSRPRTFRALSLAIAGCIAWALLAGMTGGSIYWQEAGAVVLFGWAWAIKGGILERA